jgi:hypothetical protein
MSENNNKFSTDDSKIEMKTKQKIKQSSIPLPFNPDPNKVSSQNQKFPYTNNQTPLSLRAQTSEQTNSISLQFQLITISLLAFLLFIQNYPQ